MILYTETGLTRVGTGDISRTGEEGGDPESIVTTEVGGTVATREDRAGTDTQPLPGVNTGRVGTEMNTQAMGTVVEETDISL